MKTTEEKAKAYDEALERAKECHIDGLSLHQPVKDVIEHIFPELAESEDEKIRKTLIRVLNENVGNGIEKYGAKLEDALAWLEKQGESYTKKDIDNAWLEGMCDAKRELEKQSDSPIKWNKNTKDCKPKVSHSVLMKTTHGIAEGEWQGKHWHQYRWAGLVRDADVLSWMELSNLEKQGEQKVVDWSKQIKYNPNPPSIIEESAWSEEEEVKINRIVACLENLKVADNDILLKDVDWLKSLKARYTWKPSDEQMADLWNMLCECRPADHQLLQDIYYGLKKLREE